MDSAFRYGSKIAVAGSAVADGGTVVLIAAPGASKFWRLGALNLSVSAAFNGTLRDGGITDQFTLRSAGVETIPISLPASGWRAPAANVSLELVNSSGGSVTVGALGHYKVENF